MTIMQYGLFWGAVLAIFLALGVLAGSRLTRKLGTCVFVSNQMLQWQLANERRIIALENRVTELETALQTTTEMAVSKNGLSVLHNGVGRRFSQCFEKSPFDG